MKIRYTHFKQRQPMFQVQHQSMRPLTTAHLAQTMTLLSLTADELKQEIASGRKVDIESELGDLFFSLINAARLYEIDPEAALEKTNRKFIKRFSYLEEKTLAKGLSLRDLSLDEMNEIWEESKQFDKPL